MIYLFKNIFSFQRSNCLFAKNCIKPIVFMIMDSGSDLSACIIKMAYGLIHKKISSNA